jgi:hypothetical protein
MNDPRHEIMVYGLCFMFHGFTGMKLSVLGVDGFGNPSPI